MAGIGFELKRLFSKKGIIATVRAYGYAGVVTTGPMLLGVLLLIGIMLIAYYGNAVKNDRELLLSMITYALLASLTVTSFFTMITTRYTADMLYCENKEKIMPSLLGSVAMMFVLGGAAYGTFLCFAGIPFSYCVLSLLLFLVLLLVWTETTYLTAIKDYRGILVAFAVSLAVTFLLGFCLVNYTDIDIVLSLMIAVVCGYGILASWYFCLLYKYFPEGFGSSLSFWRWVEKFPELIWVGAFTTFGLFGHLIIMWTSPLGIQVRGLFYAAPQHDVPALIAFFSILVTTMNFVTSVEVRFYPVYKHYFSLFNGRGSILDIDTTETAMLKVLRDELNYIGQKQTFATVIFIIVGTMLIPRLNLGFTVEMLGMFRVLCVGYAFYAIGNSIMLILLYFADNKGALLCSAVFAVTTNVSTWLLKDGNQSFYGFGFLIGSAIFCFTAYLKLNSYVKRMKYHILSEQPLVARKQEGALSAICSKLEKRAQRLQAPRKKYYSGRIAENEGQTDGTGTGGGLSYASDKN